MGLEFCGLCRKELGIGPEAERYMLVTGVSAYVVCRECNDAEEISGMDRIDFVRQFPNRVTYEN